MFVCCIKFTVKSRHDAKKVLRRRQHRMAVVRADAQKSVRKALVISQMFFIFIASHMFFTPVRRTFSPPPPRASSLPLYLVLYDYDPQEESELKLRAGDLVTKTDEEAGWFEGTNQTSGVSGWYSPAYVRIASSK